MENSMQSKEIEAIKIYIERSKEALSHAKYNIDGNNLSTALNRTYYACFYIVKPLSLLDNFVTSKHKVLLHWFNKEYVYTKKIFSDELFEIYKGAFENREKSDYAMYINFTKEGAIENYDNVKFFVDIIEKHILERIEKLTVER